MNNKKLIANSMAGMLMSVTAGLIVSCLMVSLYCIEAYADSINLARDYGTATANRYWTGNGGWPASDAIDGDRSTGWLSGSKASSDNPDWLIIDLGSPYVVDSINLLWFEPNGKYAGYTVEYSLYHSVDKNNWTLVGTGTFVDESINELAKSFDLSGQGLRFVKYEVTGGTHWSSIAEIEVLADNSASSVPVPASMLLLGAGLLGLVSIKKKK